MISKYLFIFPVFLLFAGTSFSQDKKYLFVGHSRTDSNEYVVKELETTDYRLYDLVFLGGDLLNRTTASTEYLDYLERLFNLNSEDTHVAIGNHDEYDNVDLLLTYTEKPRFYAFTRNNITFLILDTEVTVPDFTGDQLTLIKNVTDTISHSDYLVLVHHRIVWMIGNEELEPSLGAVASSTSMLTSTNFYSEIYPLLQDVKSRGVKAICLAGDRTNLNIEYSPEEDIQFIASGLNEDFEPKDNYVVRFSHSLDSKTLTWEFVNLLDIEKINWELTGSSSPSVSISAFPNPSEGLFYITSNWQLSEVKLYDQAGKLIVEPRDSIIDLSDHSPGVYLVHIRTKDGQEAKLKVIRQ